MSTDVFDRPFVLSNEDKANVLERKRILLQRLQKLGDTNRYVQNYRIFQKAARSLDNLESRSDRDMYPFLRIALYLQHQRSSLTIFYDIHETDGYFRFE